MKLIEAYIPPDALYDVQELLSERGIDDIVVSEVVVEAGGEHLDWGSAIPDHVPQVKLELVVSDEEATTTAHQIFNAVSGRRAKKLVQILIGRLDEVVRIETGERGFGGYIGALRLG
ncbi:MAG: P-II family nitrogen regulator [Candidatus Binataceae bacterium]